MAAERLDRFTPVPSDGTVIPFQRSHVRHQGESCSVQFATSHGFREDDSMCKGPQTLLFQDLRPHPERDRTRLDGMIRTSASYQEDKPVVQHAGQPRFSADVTSWELAGQTMSSGFVTRSRMYRGRRGTSLDRDSM